MADPTLYSFTLQDDGGVLSTFNMWVSYDGALSTVDDIIADLGARAILLDNVSDAKVIQARVTIPITPTGVKASPVADSTVERTGLITYSQDNVSRSQAFDIPAYQNAGITAGKIVESNAQFIAWDLDIKDPAAQFRSVSQFANNIVARLSTKLSFRKHRRQRIKSSIETP